MGRKQVFVEQITSLDFCHAVNIDRRFKNERL